MGSRQGRLWGGTGGCDSVTVSPRLDGPAEEMFDITLCSPQCQVTQRDVLAAALPSREVWSPSRVSNERAGGPRSS